MKVLMFNSNLSKNSGVMSVIMNYYRNINRELIQFDFMYFRESEASYNEEINQMGGKLYSICNPKNIIKFRNELKVFFNNHKNEYDIVHIHDSIFARFMYDILKCKGVKSVIIHSHATCFSDKTVSNIRNLILCHNISKYGDVMFACSDAAGKFLFSGKPFYIMNNAISIDKFKYDCDVRKEYRNHLKLGDKMVIGHIGAFVNQKNHKFLLEIFNETLKINPNSILLLAGDGPLLNDIKEKVEIMGMKNQVIFLGKRVDVNCLYQAMDVFILPSLFEGLPMVGVEAQCSGLPILMSKEITREAGIGTFQFLALEESAKEWANRLIEMYKNRNRVQKKSIEQTSNAGFNIDLEARKLEEKYYELVRG